MVSKTRDKLIEVARQLFAYKGVENTTMNDIAAASDKGRRTIYTYFKNKREIYNAVVERQSDVVISRLRAVVDSEKPPMEKLVAYLMLRFDILSETAPKHERHRLIFSRDHRRMERIQRLALAKERELFSALLKQGIAEGVFDSEQAHRLTSFLTVTFTGVDSCQLQGTFELNGLQTEDVRDNLIKFVTEGIKKQPN